LRLEHDLLHGNELVAGRNRAWLEHRGILALNLMSSPGSGKTTLLERTIADTRERFDISVIQGDQATDNDAERIRRAGARAVQINTGKGCHLDATMVARALGELCPGRGSVVAIENVGNLVCPALFALGERTRVAILSVTEGADKPLKYPYLFRGSDVVVFNKADLLPYVDFDLDIARRFVRDVNPDAVTFVVSAKTGEGMDAFYEHLARSLTPARSLAEETV
jgi:hydrogenase nickel incorporation protein HypB